MRSATPRWTDAIALDDTPPDHVLSDITYTRALVDLQPDTIFPVFFEL